jgi:hypothetical protein
MNFWTKVAKPTLGSQQMQWLFPFAFEMACFHIWVLHFGFGVSTILTFKQ